MFEIWQHTATGQRYLVIVNNGVANVASGPLDPADDAHKVLQTQSNQNHNPRALLHMRRSPGDYIRLLTRDVHGQVHPVPPDANSASTPASA